MNFLNGILLGGAAAFSIPLIIHLLNKRRFRVVHWGAMHLLAPIVKKNHRRIKLEQLLLLLMRIAIPIILALCLARPVLTSMKAYQENEKLSTVFLVDDSFSMQDGTPARSNFARAKEEIAQALGDMRKGSDASVVFMGGTPIPLLDEPTTSLDSVKTSLTEEDSEGDPIEVAEAIQNGMSELERMAHAGREIVLVSDFQAADWKDSDAVTRRTAMDRLNEMPVVPNVTLYRIADGPRENACIRSIDVSALVLGTNQPVTIRVNLKNYGSASYPDLMVYFKVDGEEKRSSQITLGPKQDAQVLFTVSFDSPGDHFVEVSMDADALKADNSYVASFPVWDEVPVLLVDGDPATGLDSETGFLEIALKPFGSSGADLTDLIRSETIQPNQLDARRLEQKRVAILANVQRLQGHQIGQLEDFVLAGGGLIVFPGDKIDVDFYNRDLFKKGKGLLPRQFTAFAGRGHDSGDGNGWDTARIVSEVYSHPAFAFFNDGRNGKLSEAEFNTWLKLGFLDDANLAGRRDVLDLARFDSGDPFAVEHKFGKGRVIMCATPADAAWGNLPMQPVYLPMMQRMVTYLAASIDPPRNVASRSKIVAFVPPDLAGQDVVVKDPAGVDHTVKVKREGSRGVVEYADTKLPGIYTVTAQPGLTFHYAVNLSRDESDISVMSEHEVRELAMEMEANFVTSYEEYRELDKARRFGIEIWKPLLVALLALLFGELIYQQWIARRVL